MKIGSHGGLWPQRVQSLRAMANRLGLVGTVLNDRWLLVGLRRGEGLHD